MKDWLSRLVARVPATVHFKLIGAFLLIVGLLVTVGGVGLQELSKVNRRAENLVKLHQKTAAYRRLQHDTTSQLYSITSTLLAPNERMLEGVLRQLNQFRYGLDRVRFVSRDEAELFGKIREEHERLIQVVTQVMGLTRAGKAAEALELHLKQAGPLAERLQRLTNEMVNRAEADMLEKIDAGHEAYLASRWAVAGFAVASIGISLLLGYAISWSLIGPVKQMDRQLSQTASGDFSQRIEIPNRDEMGALATNLNRMNEELGRLYQELEVRNRFIRETFGRYLSDEIVEDILETPDGLKLGGEKRNVSIMITDLRGFTALTERLGPEEVVTLLNLYFEVMVEVAQQYKGTINEIIGDSLVVLFGAPQEMENRVETAVACAIAMQNATEKVNRENLARGLPEVEMGIGIDDSPVVVGNIGSSSRLKYSVIGRGVNMASRIESYSVGGQILVSETVRKAVGEALLVDRTLEIFAKGSEFPARVYGVAGISGTHNLFLEADEGDLVTLDRQIPITFNILDKKQVGTTKFDASVHKLSKREAEIVTNGPVELLFNLKINLRDVYGDLAIKNFYAKVVDRPEVNESRYLIRFTSAPPEVISYFQAHLEFVLSPE